MGEILARVFRGNQKPQHRGDYRPDIIAKPSGDKVETAGRQDALNQHAEAWIDMRDGEHREEIYAAAGAFIDATEVLGMRRKRTPEERDLDIERVAFGIAAGRSNPDENIRRVGADVTMGLLLAKATNSTRRQYLEKNVIPIFYRAHGIEPPQPPQRR